MYKLRTILNEIKINKPVNRKDILDQFIDVHIHLLNLLVNNVESLDQIVKEYGSIKNFLEDEIGYETVTDELISLVENFFKYIKPTHIMIYYIDNDNGTEDNIDIKMYSFMVITPVEDATYIVLHNIK